MAWRPGRQRSSGTRPTPVRSPPHQRDPGDLRERLRAQARRHAPEDALRLLDTRLSALLQAHVARILANPGLAWEEPSLVVHRLDIVRGFADILGWELQVAKLRFLWRRERVATRNGEGYPVVTVRAVTHFYEAESAALEASLRQLVLSLYRFLLEVIDGDAG